MNRASLGQFVKYNIGGVLYFWSAWLIITFATDSIGLFWSNLIGNGVGIVLNFLVQQFWAFDGQRGHLFNSGWKFAVLTVINLGLSYGILSVLSENGVPLWLAQFVSAGFFTGWNWLWYRYWVFRSVKEAVRGK